MCNGIKVFNYNETEVRTVEIDGEPWFVLKDVCVILGVKNQADVFNRLDDDEKGMDSVDTLGGKQKMYIINESGLYNVILRSDKPEAKPFRKWVASEVLPTIRKHGVYATPEALMQMLAEPENAIKIFEALRDEREKNKQLSEKIALDAPKVHFADTVAESNDLIKIRDMAKLLCENGVNIGERRLYALLREEKVLMKDNTPYQQFIDRGYFKVKERSLLLKANIGIAKTTYVTARGQIWIANKVKEWMAA